VDEAHTSKTAKYEDIVQSAREVGFEVDCIALEVGSRGLTRDNELAQLQTALGASTKAVNELASVLSHTTILNSFNPLDTEGIYICPMSRLRIAARRTLHIYVKGISPTLLESAFDTLSPSASGLGIGHTRTKIWAFKRGS